MKKRWNDRVAMIIVVMAAGLGLAACGVSPKEEPNAERGQKVFDENCSSCHVTGRKTTAGPGLEGLMRRDFHAYLPNGMSPNEVGVRAWILKGGGDHPVFPKMSDRDLDDLVQFLKAL